MERQIKEQNQAHRYKEQKTGGGRGGQNGQKGRKVQTSGYIMNKAWECNI